ncbi:MAG: hypothetical protein LW817_03930 [Candidatus Caenarcaniphilales bacterium]|jgi:hypothetical protein|nr:hypothetical protein [Candidatus Caenarcaniphilales bacterium]
MQFDPRQLYLHTNEARIALSNASQFAHNLKGQEGNENPSINYSREQLTKILREFHDPGKEGQELRLNTNIVKDDSTSQVNDLVNFLGELASAKNHIKALGTILSKSLSSIQFPKDSHESNVLKFLQN